MATLSPATVRQLAADPGQLNAFVKNVRVMAASLLRQDEVRGLRRVLLTLAMRGVPPKAY